MWQTGKGESNNERGNGNENEAEREIENLGARLDAASTARNRNSLDGKRYVPIIVALMPWLGFLSAVIAVVALVIRQIGGRAAARRHRRGVRGCASRLAFGDISNHNRRFPETPASPSRRRRPMACPTRPTSTPAS